MGVDQSGQQGRARQIGHGRALWGTPASADGQDRGAVYHHYRIGNQRGPDAIEQPRGPQHGQRTPPAPSRGSHSGKHWHLRLSAHVSSIAELQRPSQSSRMLSRESDQNRLTIGQTGAVDVQMLWRPDEDRRGNPPRQPAARSAQAHTPVTSPEASPGARPYLGVDERTWVRLASALVKGRGDLGVFGGFSRSAIYVVYAT